MLKSKQLVFAAVAAFGTSLMTATPSGAFGFEDLGVEVGGVKVCLTVSCVFPPRPEPGPQHVDKRTPNNSGPKHVDKRRHVDKRTGHGSGHLVTETTFAFDQCKLLQAQGHRILCD